MTTPYPVKGGGGQECFDPLPQTLTEDFCILVRGLFEKNVYEMTKIWKKRRKISEFKIFGDA